MKSYRHNTYKIPDYDFGDEVLYEQSKPEKDPKGAKGKEIPILVAMCLFSFLVLGTYMLIKFTPGMEYKLGAMFYTTNDRASSAYQIGQIRLGTTMNVLRAVQPHAQKAIAPNGAITMAFSDGDSSYQIWYAEDGPYNIAYKARQDQVVRGQSEDDYINTLAKQYGAPSVSSCTQRTSDGVRDCRFSWWMPGEIRIEVISRQDQAIDRSTSSSRLMITTITTDTRLEGRMFRTKLETAAER
ncbi:hypothetical protein [Magnetovibrio blakemorei]|uniref:Uncharacterized protein n=1 Tax=Magnetovibrio blakemorei TaxID=28181 RepID=A0A1E5QAW8_9PROT|nr:hypothetical protein [Magnetovibrio blakemorei]OEJ69062.1 hypothetical protein BEN30_04970 [Magnetovibrio blakemorei]